jgi:hypothetical protein
MRSAALSDLVLLKSVVEFGECFYYSPWTRYDLAVPGSFRLSPPDSQLPALERDYRAMRKIFYREPPTFCPDWRHWNRKSVPKKELSTAERSMVAKRPRRLVASNAPSQWLR